MSDNPYDDLIHTLNQTKQNRIPSLRLSKEFQLIGFEVRFWFLWLNIVIRTIFIFCSPLRLLHKNISSYFDRFIRYMFVTCKFFPLYVILSNRLLLSIGFVFFLDRSLTRNKQRVYSLKS